MRSGGSILAVVQRHAAMSLAIVLVLGAVVFVNVRPAEAGHTSWHHTVHHGHSGSDHLYQAHAQSGTKVDRLASRMLIQNSSTSFLHGDRSSICSGSEACQDELTLSVSFPATHAHDIFGFMCGYDDPSHYLPDDGVFWSACTPAVADFHDESASH